MTHQIRDLTGNLEVEEAIRKYYVKQKMKEVAFVEGIANKEKDRVDFTIDNSYLHEVSAEEKELYNRNYLRACERYQKADKMRRKYEEMQTKDYANII